MAVSSSLEYFFWGGKGLCSQWMEWGTELSDNPVRQKR